MINFFQKIKSYWPQTLKACVCTWWTNVRCSDITQFRRLALNSLTLAPCDWTVLSVEPWISCFSFSSCSNTPLLTFYVGPTCLWCWLEQMEVFGWGMFGGWWFVCVFVFLALQCHFVCLEGYVRSFPGSFSISFTSFIS